MESNDRLHPGVIRHRANVRATRVGVHPRSGKLVSTGFGVRSGKYPLLLSGAHHSGAVLFLVRHEPGAGSARDLDALGKGSDKGRNEKHGRVDDLEEDEACAGTVRQARYLPSMLRRADCRARSRGGGDH